MLAHLRTRITAWLWDARITWRLDSEHLRPFHDAPDEVVARWAAIDENSVRRYQLHGGILMARDEQTQRACTWRVSEPVVGNDPSRGIVVPEPAPYPAPCFCGRGDVGLERSWEDSSGGQHHERHGVYACTEQVSGGTTHPCAISNRAVFVDAAVAERIAALESALRALAEEAEAWADAVDNEYGDDPGVDRSTLIAARALLKD